ncbi:MAG: hypothetical protein GX591_15195, partial [Planctomycetes bacterium]|nr:hypothetical protein [Planctomycetota bacterium]
NGEPFIPLMSWLQRSSRFSLLRSLNFNTFMGNQKTPLEQAQAAAAAGGYCVVQSSSTSDVNAAKSHTSILAWHHSDEPDLPEGSPAVPRTSPATVASRYQWYRNLNINRPVFVTFTAHFMSQFRSKYTAAQQAELYPQYVAAADVVGFDIYPIYGWGRPNWLNYPASGTSQLVELAGGKPVYAWIETSKGSRAMTYELQPDVLPVHTRFEVWGSLIQGATAIGYFTHAWEPSFTEFAPTPEMRDELFRLNGQITELTPAILAPPSDREIHLAMATAGGTVLTSHFKATEYDGNLWIFAQITDLGHNAHLLRQFDPISPRAGRATITVDGLASGTPIHRIEDDGTTTVLTSANGYFQDDFAALAEHIYYLPLELAVDADPGEDRTIVDADGDGVEAVTLDGTGSTSVNGPIVSYLWSQGATILGYSAVQVAALPVGVHTIDLTITDSTGATNKDSVVITIEAPTIVARAGDDLVVTDADGDGAETVTLDGSASWTAWGPPASYLWAEGGTFLGAQAVQPATFPVGVHTVTLMVVALNGQHASDTVTVT